MKLSDTYWQRALKVIPGGTCTLSKQACRYVEGVYPKVLSTGDGAHVKSMDGKWYIDWVGALGANLLGYNSGNNSDRGVVFSLPQFQEIELAEKIVEVVPCAEMVKFGKNGVDSTAAAVRLARAITGRNHIISYGYHGYQDLFGITGVMNDGIPEDNSKYIYEIPWGDLYTLETFMDKYVACVIMEVPPETGEDVEAYLKAAIDITHQYGALFILDEVVTGFRYALGGAHELYHVMPDLACIGKAMGNGHAISAVVGKREYMTHFDHTFFSTTFASEVSAIRAALDTIHVLQTEPVIDHIWKIGKALRSGIEELAHDNGVQMDMPGIPPRSLISFPGDDGKPDLLKKSLFMQECCLRGVLFGVPVFPTYSHTLRDVDDTLKAAHEAFKVMKKYEGHEGDGMVGKPIEGSPTRR
jgi:glutamate-1-semialdehyde aminotransferase